MGLLRGESLLQVHYMQDRERGVVWEETIIFLPSETKMVFLSATLSNAAQFAAWVAALHRQPCHVVYTDFRPTPLQHYAFAPGGKGLHLVRLILLSIPLNSMWWANRVEIVVRLFEWAHL